MTAYHAQDLSWSTSTPKTPSMDWSTYQDTRDFITDAHGNIIYASKGKETLSNEKEEREKKKPKSGISGKEGAKDRPSWAEGERPYKDESGKDFAKSPQQHDIGPKTEFNKLKKYGDRAFE